MRDQQYYDQVRADRDAYLKRAEAAERERDKAVEWIGCLRRFCRVMRPLLDREASQEIPPFGVPDEGTWRRVRYDLNKFLAVTHGGFDG